MLSLSDYAYKFLKPFPGTIISENGADLNQTHKFYKIKNIFEKEGTPYKIDGNHPILLNNPENVWMVVNEKVDIFSVKLEKGEQKNTRTHITRVECEQIFFEIDTNNDETAFLAVGLPGTSLLQLKKSRFIELAKNTEFTFEINNLIDKWLNELLFIIKSRLKPITHEVLGVSKEVVIGKDVNIKSAGELIWLSLKEGELEFMGKKDALIHPEQGFFPIPKECFLKSNSTTFLNVLDTVSYTNHDSNWIALNNFHRLIRSIVITNTDKNEVYERQRLIKKAHHENEMMSQTLHKFIDVLNPETIDTLLTNQEEDPLMSACIEVGKQSGIEVKKPPFEIKNLNNPLDVIARTSGFRIRQVMLKEDWWNKENGPLLAYKEADKLPIALIPKSHNQYELYDPNTNNREKITAKIAETIYPSAYMFYRPFPYRILKSMEILKFGLLSCRADIWTIFLMGLLGAISGLLSPIITGIIFDTVIPGAQYSQLLQIAIILFSCAIANLCFEITKGFALLRVETKLDLSLQTAIMDRLLSLPTTFFRKYTTGDLAQRVMAINSIRQTLSGVAVQTILSTIFSTLNIALIFWYDWKLALVAIGLTLLGLLLVGFLSYSQVRYQKELVKIQGKISGLILQFITGISKLRVSNTENRAFSIWANEFIEQRKQSYKTGQISNIVTTFNSCFPILTSMAIFTWVVWKSMDDLTIGNFMSFNSAYNSFQNSLLQMCMTLMSILNVVPLYKRTMPILETMPEIDETKEYPGELSGEIEVNHLSFKYNPEGPEILKDISLYAKPGEFIAIVGSSGAGKSTLLRLLLGFEKPDSGSIYYDGQDLSTIDIREVRRQIGVVLQNSQLLGGDIFKNIVGSSNLTIESAWEASRMAGLEKDIKEMPMEMHTVISPGGGNISGGQKQRILIARAMINKPRMIFFDEATSALDNETQSIVSRSLENLMTTRIVIAHRLSTIINADRIYVFKNGRIVESGNYKELIDNNSFFAELAKRQIA
ncbi:MAG: NHLP bacteriocin export ABC transporter permease/ATPase subunit [Desulfobacterales bacterium]|nr:NHLP bacteriocin export ABC transporter permease/ATPase subunit [Desulfobacterales bacterium]